MDERPDLPRRAAAEAIGARIGRGAPAHQLVRGERQA